MTTMPRLDTRRVLRQTSVLIQKNLLIALKKPISTFVSTLLIPIALTLIFCYLKNIKPVGTERHQSGINHESFPVRDLADAMAESSSRRLAFVTNGISDQGLTGLIQDLSTAPEMENMEMRELDDIDALSDVCPQTIQGTSDCFASVIFDTFDEAVVNYTIAVSSDSFYNTPLSMDGHQSLLSNYLAPLQWAINSRLGNLDGSLKPRERLWDNLLGSGSTTMGGGPSISDLATSGAYWLQLVQQFIAPLFIFIFIGATHHISKSVASERELAELMAVQRITLAPRILSNILSFIALYLPGWIICSILFPQILFVHTSGGVFFILTVLCGVSLVTASHFVGSFFRKPSVAAMTSSILFVVLALITLAANLQVDPSVAQIKALAVCFPPTAWATLISDTATAEMQEIMSAFSGSRGTDEPVISHGLYAVFFIVQIIFYLSATFLAETLLWNVPREYDTLDPSGSLAVRITNLSKTYSLPRRWYWPFSRRMAEQPAVNDVSFDVSEGNITFLLGPNGGGKTSLLKCVTGMVSPNAPSKIALRPNHDIFGICPQNNIFWGTLTVKQHIKIWRKLRNAASDTIINDDEDVIAECDLVEKLHAAAGTLSGGQLRKLQLATAFVGGSKMCCIDEASSGLDPLSRRNIWDIIQNGKAKRTVLITTHSLDEADVLADHIIVMYRGSVACHGSSTSLKGQYGAGYSVSCTDRDNPDEVLTWKFNTSAEATRKVLELEAAGMVCDVTYPTLEQVFLRVTPDSGNLHGIGDDGAMLGPVDDGSTTDDANNNSNDNNNNKLEAAAEHSGNGPADLNLEVAKSIGILRQTWVLFRKRCILLQSYWFSYLVNIAVPIVVAAALYKFLQEWETLRTCDMQREAFYSAPVLKNPTVLDSVPGSAAQGQIAAVGPEDSFSSDAQNQWLVDNIAPYIGDDEGDPTSFSAILETVTKVPDEDALLKGLEDNQGRSAFGLWAPAVENNTISYSGRPVLSVIGMGAFNYMTNRLTSMTASTKQTRHVATSVQVFNNVPIEHDMLNLPLQMLLVLAFIVSASTSVLYPTFEKRSYVRALQYSNGVSPLALWLAYLLFDLQFILIESLIVWGLWFSGANGARIWYESSYIFGVFILFGLATYLGTYLVSIYFTRGVFGAAAGIHILLTAIYFAAYVMNQFLGSEQSRQDVYTSLQNGLGLVCPGANLARGLWLAMNTFDTLCGKYGTADVSYAMAYSRYGGVYCNLILQILFLAACLGAYEYGSAEWLRRRLRSKGKDGASGPLKRSGDSEERAETGEIPLRRLTVSQSDPEAPNTPARSDGYNGDNITTTTTGLEDDGSSKNPTTLQLFNVRKAFRRSVAVDDVSFDISQDQMMALLGANGAGKTTIFNMIRGELRPDNGRIYVEGVSVVDQPSKARLHIGVCPQQDAVDNLTVRQTLKFYASVKGLRDIDANVDQVLRALNITSFSRHAVKALSGGTKRKLTVCIALLGNPQLLLLDEPSTGQDAGAKRLLWRALQRVSKGRAILLTTHSMEEAETLADKAAIISGRMLASGSLSQLQDLHGGLYKVRGVRVGVDVDRFAAENQVKQTFRQLGMDVLNYWDSNGLVQFQLVHDRTMLGVIMRTMEALTTGNDDDDDHSVSNSNDYVAGDGVQSDERHVFMDYMLSGPTLEEIFVNVMRKERREE